MDWILFCNVVGQAWGDFAFASMITAAAFGMWTGIRIYIYGISKKDKKSPVKWFVLYFVILFALGFISDMPKAVIEAKKDRIKMVIPFAGEKNNCKKHFYLVTAIKADQSKHDYIESITKLLDSRIYECTKC